MSIEKEFRPYRVLIVDDLDHERIAIIVAIEAAVEGCEIVEAKNVTDAEHVLTGETQPCDLAVIDLKLEESDKDGVALVGIIKQVLQRHSATRVIIYTAYPSMDSACAAYEAGASAYISKLDVDSTEKLQEKSKELLEQPDLRQVLRLQHEALENAKKALAKNREDWVEKYGGKFVLVRNGEVIKGVTNDHVILAFW